MCHRHFIHVWFSDSIHPSSCFAASYVRDTFSKIPLPSGLCTTQSLLTNNMHALRHYKYPAIPFLRIWPSSWRNIIIYFPSDSWKYKFLSCFRLMKTRQTKSSWVRLHSGCEYLVCYSNHRHLDPIRITQAVAGKLRFLLFLVFI